MLVWAVIARMPALKKAGIDLGAARGGRPGGLDGVVDENAQWKMHNYIHLVEQPVLFYAICGVLALAEAGGGFNAQLAWAYVALRMLHSLIQALVNVILLRFAVFMVASGVLVVLAVRATMAVFQGPA